MDINDLESKTVAQLKEIAKELSITGISGMKKADLISAVADAEPAEEPSAVEPAPETTPVEEEAPVEEGAAAAPEAEAAPVEEAAPAEEEVAQAAPEVASEPAPEPDPEPADTDTEPAKAAEPKAKKPEAAVTIQSRAKRKLLEKNDIPALKKEKKTLKGRIAQAVEAKDVAKVRELRNRKKELRRILNRAS